MELVVKDVWYCWVKDICGWVETSGKGTSNDQVPCREDGIK